MPNTLLPKRSAVANKVPTTSDLASGELGVNMADRKVYINNGGSIVQVGAGLLSALADVNLTGLASGNTISWNGTAWVASAAGAGTVTSVVAGTGLTGGTINTTGTIALAASGVTAGTYTKITVDEYGRATAGTSLGSSDVTTALGFTPANKAGDTFTGNVLINSGADSRLLIQNSGTTQAQLQVTASLVRLSSNNTLPLNISTSGVDRVTFNSDGLVTFASSTFIGLGGTPSTSARLRVIGTGTSSEVARIEGGTLSALLLINQTDAPGVNTNRSGISFRKNNTEGGAISVEYNGTRGIVYYDASGATGQHAFYVNGSDVARFNQFGGVSFNGAGYGTAGQILKSGGASAAAAWGSITSTDVTTALGFTPIAGNQSISLSGDATGTGTTSIAVTLANSGVTAGTYTKVTVDAKGRVTSGAALASADLPTYTGTLTSSQVTTALGFTPYNSTNPSGYITSSALSSYLPLAGGTLTGQLNSSGGDSARLFQSNNTSAVGSPAQFFIEHNLGNVNIGNARGNINFSSGALQQGGNQVLHAGNFTTYAPSLTGSGASGSWGINVTGSAGSVAWTNVSGRPTALSSFTNDSGYITNTGNARVGVENNGTLVGTRRNINFIPGTGISLSISDDAANEEVDITITSTVTGGVTSFNTRTGAVSLSSSDVTTALGYTPYNSSNPSGYITSSGSISGSAGSVSGLTLTSSANGINPDNVTQNQIGYNTSVSLFGQTDGGLYSSAFSSSWIHQIYGDFRTGQIAIRGKNSGTWQAWRTVLDSGNFGSFALPLSGGTLSGTLRLGDSSNGLYLSSGRLTVRSESADNVANFASYGLYLPVLSQTAGLYVESPIEARTGLRMGSGAANGTITVGADTGVVGNRIVQRDGNGYIYANHINFSTSESENPTINSFITSNGDGWSRKSSLQHVKNSIRGVADGTWSINVTGSAGSVPWSGISSRPSNIMYYQSFTLDANTMDSNATGFTYSVNAPYTGPIARFSTGGGYDLWLNSPYWGGNDLAFRTRNGDTATLNPWRVVLHNGNFTSYSPGLTGSGASGTWGISITGNAGNTSSISNAVGGSYTWTGAQYFQSNLGATSGSLSSPPLQVYATGGNSAFMSFHRGGNYAVNMGLDSDNVLRIGGWSASANRLQMDMSGNLTMAGNVTAYSDERLKKDWATPSQGYIERLAKIRSGTYTRIDSGERQAGASAQDWQALLPEVVSEDNDGYLALAYGNAAVVSVIELAKDNLNLRARIDRLESLINKLIGE